MSQATYVRTGTVPIERLKPFPGNARHGDIPAILDSLRRNAQYRSVVARQNGRGRLTVLAGNNTLAALREHGPGDCGFTHQRDNKPSPCGVCNNDADYKPALRTEIITCDDATARRINLADNKTADLGSYDDHALAELLADLDDDLTGTGYTEEDLDELLNAAAPLAEATTEVLTGHATPEPPPGTPWSAPALNPFSDAPPTGSPPQVTPAPAQPIHTPAPAMQPPAAAPTYSAGVHTGPAPYTGPGARQHPGSSIALPEPVQTVSLQWNFTIPQRDTVRAAIRAAQTAGEHDTAAKALTAICAAYLASTDGATAHNQGDNPA